MTPMTESKALAIAFTGTRRYTRNRDAIEYLEATGPSVVIVGCADGLDEAVRDWAESRCILVVVHAPWPALGKAAGPKRNRHLARIARHYANSFRDVWCAAFPDESSIGTFDCARAMRELRVQIRWPGDAKWEAMALKKLGWLS